MTTNAPRELPDKFKGDDFTSNSEGYDPLENGGLNHWYGDSVPVTSGMFIAGMIVLVAVQIIGFIFTK